MIAVCQQPEARREWLHQTHTSFGHWLVICIENSRGKNNDTQSWSSCHILVSNKRKKFSGYFKYIMYISVSVLMKNWSDWYNNSCPESNMPWFIMVVPWAVRANVSWSIMVVPWAVRANMPGSIMVVPWAVRADMPGSIMVVPWAVRANMPGSIMVVPWAVRANMPGSSANMPWSRKARIGGECWSENNLGHLWFILAGIQLGTVHTKSVMYMIWHPMRTLPTSLSSGIQLGAVHTKSVMYMIWHPVRTLPTSLSSGVQLGAVHTKSVMYMIWHPVRTLPTSLSSISLENLY